MSESGVECPVLLFYSLQLYSQVVNGGFSINMFIFQVQKRTQNKLIIQQRARKEAEIPMAKYPCSFHFSSKNLVSKATNELTLHACCS